MKRAGVAFACGVLFSVGLGVSQMTTPGKVIGFLDVFGDWDPSLLVVMAGAVLVYALGHRLALRLGRPLIARRFHVDDRGLDARLFVGAAAFGVGWGLSGFCPGPAVTSVATGALPVLVFVGAMLSGMALHDGLLRPIYGGSRSRRASGASVATNPEEVVASAAGAAIASNQR